MVRSRLQRAVTKANQGAHAQSSTSPPQLLSALPLDNTLSAQNIIPFLSSRTSGSLSNASGLDLLQAALCITALESQVLQLENEAQNALIIIENHNDRFISLEEQLQNTQQQLTYCKGQLLHTDSVNSLLRARNSSLSRKVCRTL